MAEKPTKKQPNKLARKIVRDNENGARQAILDIEDRKSVV